MAWTKATSKTLDATNNDITTDTFTASKTLQFIDHTIVGSGNVVQGIRVGNGTIDSSGTDAVSGNYALRRGYNGANEVTRTYRTHIHTQEANYGNSFGVVYVLNIAGKEKLFISHNVDSGSSTIVGRTEVAGKWANTTNQINVAGLTEWDSGSFGSGTNLTVIGSDGTPSAIAPETNSIFIETDTAYRYWFNGTNWINPIPTRGLFSGGSSSGEVIDYITIDTTGNASDFGDLTLARYTHGAVNDSTRGVWGGGYNSGLAAYQNVMDYVTIATTGNAIDFGDLTVARGGSGQGVNSDTRGVFGGGTSGVYQNTMDYITIATTGNATDFGDMIRAKQGYSGCGSKTRGLFGGGITVGDVYLREIDYITIATTGNALDFGDLSTTIRYYPAAADDTLTRGVWAGGENPSNTTINVIDYVTIATTGNATDFGDLTQARLGMGAVNSDTRACFGSGSNYNIIDYITVATTGNATDFGDMTVNRTFARGVEGS